MLQLKKRIHTSLKFKKKCKKKHPPTIVTSLRMQPSLRDQVTKIAEADQRTFNSLVIKTLTKMVKRENLMTGRRTTYETI
jgi:predicted HicB family RNase H-like nuclease